MKKILCLFSFLFLFSCNNERQKETTENQEPIDGIISEFSRDLDLNGIDSLFISRLDTSQTLSYQSIRSVGLKLLDVEAVDDLKYAISNACLIDSLKQINWYTEYLEKLDIGMIKSATAYSIGKTKIGDAVILIWAITLSSYEACPFYSGSFIIGSYQENSNTYVHIPLGKIYSAGDPPAGMSKLLTSKFKENEITIISKVVSDEDMEVAGETKETETIKLLLQEGKIKILEDLKK